MATKTKIKIFDNSIVRMEIDDHEQTNQIDLAKWAIKRAKHILPFSDTEKQDKTSIENGFNQVLKSFYLAACKILFSILLALGFCLTALSQSPEIALREFASGQIKKGVRSIGMGGDGATWGNYSLVWRDSSTAIIDAGATTYNNKNNFSFTAVGYASPAMKHGLTIYAMALSQYATDISAKLKSSGLGTSAVQTHGNGSNQAIFVKAAMPLGKGFSFGILLSYERSQYNAICDTNASDYIRYQTGWLPSGGLGLTWQPNKRFLFGFRALLNQDMEKRTDSKITAEGLNLAHEYRLGASIGLWHGALIDIGGNLRYRSNQINNTSSLALNPNCGFEQNLWNRHFALRFGLDESSGTGGFSIRTRLIIFEGAYLYNLGMARLSALYGTSSNSFIFNLIYNYGNHKSKPQLKQ